MPGPAVTERIRTILGWSVPEVDLFDDAYSLPLAS